jgi:hypothetical protein
MLKMQVTTLISIICLCSVLITSFAKADNTNLCSVPNGWTSSYNGMRLSINGASNIVLDSSITHNGHSSVRIDPVGATDNYAREADGAPHNISPGDHIVFSCWIKTSSSTLGDISNQAGGRIGIDFYGPNGLVTGTASPDGQVWTPSNGYPSITYLNYVVWGTSTWTKITMDFAVASTYPAAEGGNYQSGQMVTPTAIIPWLQVWSIVNGASDGGSAWFADSELYINPTVPISSTTLTETSTPAVTYFYSSNGLLNLAAVAGFLWAVALICYGCYVKIRCRSN